MKLSELTNRRVELSVPVEGGELKFAYNAAVYTPAFQEELRAKRSVDDEEETVLNFYSFAFPKLVVDWDIEDEKGKRLPVTSETVRRIPMEVLDAMLSEINKHRRPFESAPKSEPSGSFS